VEERKKAVRKFPIFSWVSALVQVGDRIAAACCTHLNPDRSGRVIKFGGFCLWPTFFFKLYRCPPRPSRGHTIVRCRTFFDHSWIWGVPTILVPWLSGAPPLVLACVHRLVPKWRSAQSNLDHFLLSSSIASTPVPSRPGGPSQHGPKLNHTSVHHPNEGDKQMTFTSQANDPPARLPKLPVNQTLAHSWPVNALF
jgi:hypothetical protein